MKAKDYMDLVADAGCVLCLEHYSTHTPCEVHHVAEGSGRRSDFMVVGLCPEHHRGATGLHGLGVKAFCDLWGLANEYALLGLVNKWVAK